MHNRSNRPLMWKIFHVHLIFQFFADISLIQACHTASHSAKKTNFVPAAEKRALTSAYQSISE